MMLLAAFNLPSSSLRSFEVDLRGRIFEVDLRIRIKTCRALGLDL